MMTRAKEAKKDPKNSNGWPSENCVWYFAKKGRVVRKSQ